MEWLKGILLKQIDIDFLDGNIKVHIVMNCMIMKRIKKNLITLQNILITQWLKIH